MNYPTFQELKRLRKALEKAWDKDTGHPRYKLEKGSPSGQCYVSVLYAYLKLEKYKPIIISGDIGRGDNDHYWLEIDGKIIDFTADQFTELELPPIVFGSYNQYPNYIALKKDTTFPRFLKLYRKIEGDQEPENVFQVNVELFDYAD